MPLKIQTVIRQAFLRFESSVKIHSLYFLVFTKTTSIKKLLLVILSWFLFVNSSDTIDFWEVLVTDQKTGTVTKVKRSEYLEYKELMNPNHVDINHTKNYYRIMVNESVNWTYRHKINDI